MIQFEISARLSPRHRRKSHPLSKIAMLANRDFGESITSPSSMRKVQSEVSARGSSRPSMIRIRSRELTYFRTAFTVLCCP